MCRWTNPLPAFFADTRWLDGDETHLDEYLTQWNEMRADWNEHGGDEQEVPEVGDDMWSKWDDKFHFNMTSVYAPYPFMAPHGYGLVVIDYQTKTMLHSQGYSNFVEIHPSTIRDVMQAVRGERETVKIDGPPLLMDLLGSEEEEQKEIARVLKLFERGCVCVMPFKSDDFKNARKVPDIETAAGLIAEAEAKEQGAAWFTYRFFFDPAPWAIRRFSEGPEGVRELRQAVEEMGFRLTDHEKQLWDEYEHQWEDA